ncbi:YsnF/AvaK domain-containing protein [Aerococcus viridans]|uniref:YsnF/AvaK domain-containing protein n=1 Tax=Aerococcus viridans TaxID=1377 RepID=UPI00223A9523|nr:DUF2382 domain-containing protein [Aerococcus viridans]MCT1798680.1 DUF2382 domain-containing protein [Aerococcus viridans]
MERDSYTVIGKYRDPAEVRVTLKRLEREGYDRNDIALYSNRANFNQFEDTMGVDVRTADEVSSTRSDGDRSFWDEIKDMFTMDDDYGVETTQDDFITPYREDIQDGYTVIAVRNYRGDTEIHSEMTDTNVTPLESDLPEADTTVGMDREVQDTTEMTENETIQLKEERLHVGKEEVQTGEVHVTKKTVHDTETIEVPVEREEVVIERRAVHDGEVDITDTTFDDETESITIPVHEEKVVVDKDTVVTEEIGIKKEHEEDVEHVSEDIRREEIDIESSGNVRRTDTTLDDETIDLEDPDRPDRI